MSTPNGPQDPYQPSGENPYGQQPPVYGQQPPVYGQQGYPVAPSPGYGYGTPQGAPPPNYLVWAILTTVFCCLPLGIASIVFSTQVNSKWAMGDVQGAYDSSGKAKKFAIWGAIIGAIAIVLYVVFVVVLGANAGFQSYTWSSMP